MQDPYPAMNKNRQASAPAATRPTRPISSGYGMKNPVIMRDEKPAGGGLNVTSSRMVSKCVNVSLNVAFSNS